MSKPKTRTPADGTAEMATLVRLYLLFLGAPGPLLARNFMLGHFPLTLADVTVG